jgi:hypothetical protein
LRHALWLALHQASVLRLHSLEHRLTEELIEVDRLLAYLDERA